MKKVIGMGALALLMVGSTMVFSGCKDDDPEYATEAPEVEVYHSISGYVTTVSGDPISGATVTMSSTETTTGSDGTFLFEDVDEGTYTLTASASGKISKSTEVTVSSSGSGMNPVWNVSLSNEGTTVTVATIVSDSESVESEVIAGNDEGIITVTVTAESEDVIEAEDGATITITTLYSEDDIDTSRSASARASEEKMLIGTQLSCSDSNATINGSLSLAYDIDDNFVSEIQAKKYNNGSWEDIDFTQTNGQVIIEATEFTSYSLVCTVSTTSSTSTQSLSFTESTWDNTSGSSSVSVTNAYYTYYVGANITTTAANKVTAYLIELLARVTGSTYQTVSGTYPLNITLPAGTGLTISATQKITTYTISSKTYSATGKMYGDVTITANSYTRDHTGGSN